MKTVTKRDAMPPHLLTRKRVAGYGRVSGGKDAMYLSSEKTTTNHKIKTSH